SHAGVDATRTVTAQLQRAATPGATGGVRLLIGTDQEGGAVQVLQGPGFGAIPSALEQGQWRPSTLRARAATWAAALRSAGVTVDLAPVEDTVPSPQAARHNPPIGMYDREFGYTVRIVAHHGLAFVRGMRDRGVATAVKHFPGLGRVHGNTDTTAGVTDTVTTRHDAYLQPFATSIADGAELVMMSTAIYRRLDPHRPAAFSPFVVGTMLRGDLGFRGVVVSDDLGKARQVAAWSPGARAVAFLRAGGDLVLTVDPGPLPAMYDAVLARARSHPRFRSLVDAAALRVLGLKQHHQLL
ncbi:MAG: glycoside hydrolase family 3 N-terminal domain-containing protein, partial [Marmoricola sp.]